MGEGDIFQLAWPWTISLHVEKTREKKKAQEEERGAQGADVRVILYEPCVCDVC